MNFFGSLFKTKTETPEESIKRQKAENAKIKAMNEERQRILEGVNERSYGGRRTRKHRSKKRHTKRRSRK